MFSSVLSHLVLCWHQAFHPCQNGLATTTCLLSQISNKSGLEGVLILFSKFTVKLCPLTLLHWQEAHSWQETMGNSAVTFSQEGKILNVLLVLPHYFQLCSKLFEWDFGILEVSTWLLPWEWLTFTFPIEGTAMAVFPEEMQPVVFGGHISWVRYGATRSSSFLMVYSVKNLRAKALTNSFQFYFLSWVMLLEGYLSPESGQQDFAQRKRVCVVWEAQFSFLFLSSITA